MPKSRFNAVREKARRSRHNPIETHGRRGNDSEEHAHEFQVRPRTNGTYRAAEGDVLPVLKSLPLDKSAAEEVSGNDALWALTSLASFLSVKAQRVELLQPKHELVRRIVLHLDPARPIEVRDAASGCLRNICIEAGGKARKMLEQKDCLFACIAEVKAAARDLELLGADHKDEPATARHAPISLHSSNVKQDMSFLKKPREEMNRKERRQAAKAEAAAAKKQLGRNGGADNPVEATMADAGAGPETGDSLSDEHLLACCSHLNNLVAVLWCLTEMSSTAMDVCERSGAMLCSVFVSATERAAHALDSSQSQPAAATPVAPSHVVDVGKLDKKQLDKAHIELATTCLNALVTMSESNARFSAALAGYSHQELNSALKGKGKGMVLDEIVLESEIDRSGRRNLQALQAVSTKLSHGRAGSSGIHAVQRQANVLGLLALAALHNANTTLPQSLSASVRLAAQSSETQTLAEYELHTGLPSLVKLLSEYSAGSFEALVARSTKVEAREDTKLGAVEDEDINIVNLALEILAEYAGDRRIWRAEGKKAKDSEDTIQVDEVSDDDEMDGDEDGESNDGSFASMDMIEESEAVGENDRASSSKSAFTAQVISKYFTVEVIDTLSRLSFQAGQQALAALQEASPITANAAALRGISIRSLSALSNILLAVASFGKPPPSQPISSPAHEAQVASFHQWLADIHISAKMGQLWRWSFELASRMAALPRLAQETTDNPEDLVAMTESRRILENCLGIMWSLSRCYEGYSASSDVLVVNAASFQNDPFCVTAHSGAGVVDSLIAAYRGSKQTRESEVQGMSDEPTVAAGDPTTWASADGIRVHCLGALAALVRQAHVWQTKIEPIAGLLCAAIEALPASREQQVTALKLASLELNDATSIDGMIVAINGVIDTFADETQPWDHAYSQMKLQSKLKRVSQDVRSAARTIDKRKNATLRAAADDASTNLFGFLQYRDSIGR